jgi:hypothetical protein
MTEEQIEKAARKLCELRGIDPDRRVSHAAPPTSMGYVPAVLMYSPAWTLVASEIRGFWMMIEAIDFATDGEAMS